MALIITLIIGLVLYPLIFDLLALPAPAGPPWLRRAVVGNLVAAHGLFLLLLVFTGMPWFALYSCVVVLTTVLFVNNAKYRTLNEPMIVSDIQLASQVIFYPRLYVPFFGTAAAVILSGLAVMFGLGIAVAEWTAAPLPGPWRITAAGYLALIAAVLVACYLNGAAARVACDRLLGMKISADAAADVRNHGLLPVLFAYVVLGRADREQAVAEAHRRLSEFGQRFEAARGKPRAEIIIAVQAESFFDIRHAVTDLGGTVLEHFDRARARARRYGRLAVPAWGAYTIRTEFSFLTGADPAGLGLEGFNPYRGLARSVPWSYPQYLNAHGFGGVCVHPYHADFFGRDAVLPDLGIPRFVDIRDFDSGPGPGAYVGDRDFGKKVIELCDARKGPLFVFGITMEAHGPFFLEYRGPLDDDIRRTGGGRDDPDLTVYLRHLRNTDAMIGMLLDYLDGTGRPFTLCVYGDHPPSLPRTYTSVGFQDNRTDYVIVTDSAGAGRQADLHVKDLFAAMLSEK